ncbi:MAG: exodeoxyribonuclease I [Brachymonas denitrificans]|uniref:exodeoxyribonuclease I n=1 Tax=Brachymonas denitrificans TaxID=28220 RepID=UPI001BCE1AF5|nr:exodeoxyribonuclease I [Brachymonas denitrificans]
MIPTFLWHDYETFGINPRSDRPAQFAAIRTDADLNEIGEPINILCQPAPDYLPSPGSCLITGITPQQCLQQGLPEWQFARTIHEAMAQPGTIGVGYNTIRFDDEFTRFLFWRNLIDPYGREWQNECGRWDLLDVVRMTYALRPQGIEWPVIDGKPSFKLEHLSAANGLVHEAAHDALSDVRATIALARLLREKQPRLFEFALGLRRKDRVASELGLPATQQTAQPFLHVSGMVPAERGCLALMWPLASHPTNRNELLAWDLRHDPSELALLDAEAIRQRLFTRSDALPAGVQRLPIKSIHLNKSPMVVRNLRTLSPEMAARWQFELEPQLQHAVLARDLPDMSAIWAQVFTRPAAGTAVDVDGDLYGGFLGNGDRRKLDELRQLSPAQLATSRSSFEDERLPELLFRYRARNFPDTLTPEEAGQWQEHCTARLLDGEGGARSVDALLAELDELQQQDLAPESMQVLEQLYEYAEMVVPQD